MRRGEPWIWDATNLTRDCRGPLIQLCRNYGARVEIVAVEAPYADLWRQNRERQAPVPEYVMQRMLTQWQTPELTEAHALTWVE